MPGTEYAKICADVMLVNPPGVVANHTHTIENKTPANGTASDLKTFEIGTQK